MTATSGQFVKIASMVDGTLRLTIDVPKERAQEALAVLGFPAGQTVALARLNESAGAVLPGTAAAADAGAPASFGPPEPADAGVASRPATNICIPKERAQFGAKRAWHELTRAQRAGIRCGEPRFAEFLAKRWRSAFCGDCDSDPAEFVRGHCGIRSRSELDTSGLAAARWDALDAEYRAWAGLEPEPRG